MEEILSKNLETICLLIFASILIFSVLIKKSKQKSTRKIVEKTFDQLSNYNAPKINIDNCVGCNNCIKVCPKSDILKRNKNKVMVSDPSRCISCGICVKKCPYNAMSIERKSNKKLSFKMNMV